MNVDFEIKNNVIFGVIAWLFAIGGLMTAMIVTVLYFTIPMNDTVFVVTELLGTGFAVVGGLSIYIYAMEKFELRDGKFFYRKPFKKSQSAAVHEIDRVEAVNKMYPFLCDVIFYGKDGKKLIHFYDDGTAFSGGKLLKALNEYQIPIFYKNFYQ